MVQEDGTQLHLGRVYPFHGPSPKPGACLRSQSKGGVVDKAGTWPRRGPQVRGHISHYQGEMQTCIKESE